MAQRGRPTRFTNVIADEICRRLAEGESVLQISRDASMPAESTIRSWADDGERNPKSKFAQFSANYARAKDWGWEHHADQILELADTPRIVKSVSIEDGPRGKRVTTTIHDQTERTRQQIDARKWLLSKRASKRYGDRIETVSRAAEQSGHFHEVMELWEKQRHTELPIDESE